MDCQSKQSKHHKKKESHLRRMAKRGREEVMAGVAAGMMAEVMAEHRVKRLDFSRSTSPTTTKTSGEQKDAKASSRDRDEETSQPSAAQGPLKCSTSFHMF